MPKVAANANQEDGRFLEPLLPPRSRLTSSATSSSWWTLLIMSTSSSSDLSTASTKVNGHLTGAKERQSRTRTAVTRLARSASAQDVLLFLVAFRILNALTVRTFFQPDEYFQSLEPAWRMVFGEESGAWITWVCLANSFSANCTLN